MYGIDGMEGNEEEGRSWRREGVQRQRSGRVTRPCKESSSSLLPPSPSPSSPAGRRRERREGRWAGRAEQTEAGKGGGHGHMLGHNEIHTKNTWVVVGSGANKKAKGIKRSTFYARVFCVRARACGGEAKTGRGSAHAK